MCLSRVGWAEATGFKPLARIIASEAWSLTFMGRFRNRHRFKPLARIIASEARYENYTVEMWDSSFKPLARIIASEARYQKYLKKDLKTRFQTACANYCL